MHHFKLNSNELINAVLKLWAAGATSGQIGEKLGLTRGRVMGVVHRQRKHHPELVERRMDPQERKPVTVFQEPSTPAIICVPEPEPEPEPEPDVLDEDDAMPEDAPEPEATLPSQYADLMTVTGCRYVVQARPALYCNEKKRPDPRGRPYCEHHFNLMYQKPERPRRDDGGLIR